MQAPQEAEHVERPAELVADLNVAGVHLATGEGQLRIVADDDGRGGLGEGGNGVIGVEEDDAASLDQQPFRSGRAHVDRVLAGDVEDGVVGEGLDIIGRVGRQHHWHLRRVPVRRRTERSAGGVRPVDIGRGAPPSVTVSVASRSTVTSPETSPGLTDPDGGGTARTVVTRRISAEY